jgi:hypothetical protein
MFLRLRATDSVFAEKFSGSLWGPDGAVQRFWDMFGPAGRSVDLIHHTDKFDLSRLYTAPEKAIQAVTDAVATTGHALSASTPAPIAVGMNWPSWGPEALIAIGIASVAAIGWMIFRPLFWSALAHTLAQFNPAEDPDVVRARLQLEQAKKGRNAALEAGRNTARRLSQKDHAAFLKNLAERIEIALVAGRKPLVELIHTAQKGITPIGTAESGNGKEVSTIWRVSDPKRLAFAIADAEHPMVPSGTGAASSVQPNWSVTFFKQKGGQGLWWNGPMFEISPPGTEGAQTSAAEAQIRAAAQARVYAHRQVVNEVTAMLHQLDLWRERAGQFNRRYNQAMELLQESLGSSDFPAAESATKDILKAAQDFYRAREEMRQIDQILKVRAAELPAAELGISDDPLSDLMVPPMPDGTAMGDASSVLFALFAFLSYLRFWGRWPLLRRWFRRPNPMATEGILTSA